MDPSLPALSQVVIPLLKGVLHQQSDPERWHLLLTLQPRVRDYIQVLGLELILDESEGYAFLRARVPTEGEPEIPRLVARRPLSFHVSLLLVLLRKRLAEFDATGGESRLILSREEVAELIRVFLPQTTNEVRLFNDIDTYLGRVVDLGFIRRLKTQEHVYEVRRILKVFVDAQWLAEFETRLAGYRSWLADKRSTGVPLDNEAP